MARLLCRMGGSLTLQNIHLTDARAHNEVSFISVWARPTTQERGAILVNRGSRLELVNSRFTDNAAADFGGVLDAWIAKSLSAAAIQRQ